MGTISNSSTRISKPTQGYWHSPLIDAHPVLRMHPILPRRPESVDDFLFIVHSSNHCPPFRNRFSSLQLCSKARSEHGYVSSSEGLLFRLPQYVGNLVCVTCTASIRASTVVRSSSSLYRTLPSFVHPQPLLMWIAQHTTAHGDPRGISRSILKPERLNLYNTHGPSMCIRAFGWPTASSSSPGPTRTREHEIPHTQYSFPLHSIGRQSEGTGKNNRNIGRRHKRSRFMLLRSVLWWCPR
ncbi:hypothetical protein CPB85DRAFT_1308245 [Mucidula mucida]|nr:hypothetical protein CPB85DRAFT_1308245 [Mucidula mucida]